MRPREPAYGAVELIIRPVDDDELEALRWHVRLTTGAITAETPARDLHVLRQCERLYPAAWPPTAAPS